MYMLVLQTFLLMLAAFLLGATFACLLKRTVHRLAGNDMPAEALHVDVPPAVLRPVPVSTPSAAVRVNPGDTHRFERALHGDVAEAVVTAPVVRQAGPVIEVQPLPVPPPPLVAEPVSAPVAVVAIEAPQPDTRSYAAIAVSSHDGSTLPPPGVLEATLAPPVMPGPAPEALPVPLVAIPQVQRPGDAPDAPNKTYVEEALRAGYVFTQVAEVRVAEYQLPEPGNLDHYEVPPAGESYASIAVGGGRAGANEAADDDVMQRSYAEEALASGHTYTPTPEPAVEDFQLSPVADTNQFEVLPSGETYASVAVGGAAPTDVDVSDGSLETTHVTVALASAAGWAAERAAAGASGADDLTRIQGIDEVLASRLHYAGVTRFAQIAKWDRDDVRRMSQTLGFFGRIQDEYWIDQARELAGVTFRAQPEAASFEPEAEEYVEVHATPASAAGIASAAAAAAAAAMAASTTTRRSKEDASDRMSGHDGDEASVRSNMSGLRSVRSGALLGEDAQFVRGDLDDLKRIRGIGVLIEKKLNSLGVTSYEQVANWSAADIERVSDVLDFKGRIERENWVEQARILASGGQTEFSRRVDRGEA